MCVAKEDCSVACWDDSHLSMTFCCLAIESKNSYNGVTVFISQQEVFYGVWTKNSCRSC